MTNPSQPMKWGQQDIGVNNVWSFPNTNLQQIWSDTIASNLVAGLSVNDDHAKMVASYQCISWLLYHACVQTFGNFKECDLRGQVQKQCTFDDEIIIKSTLEILSVYTMYDDDLTQEMIDYNQWWIILDMMDKHLQNWSLLKPGFLCMSNLINFDNDAININMKWQIMDEMWSIIKTTIRNAGVASHELIKDDSNDKEMLLLISLFTTISQCLSSVTVTLIPQTQEQKTTLKDYSLLLLKVGTIMPTPNVWMNIGESEPFGIMYETPANTRKMIHDYLIKPWKWNLGLWCNIEIIKFIITWIEINGVDKDVFDKSIVDSIFIGVAATNGSTEEKQEFLEWMTVLMEQIVIRNVHDPVLLESMIDFCCEVYNSDKDQNKESTFTAGVVLSEIICQTKSSKLKKLWYKSQSIQDALQAAWDSKPFNMEYGLQIQKASTLLAGTNCAN